MYGPDVAILLTYRSHGVRHVDLRKLTVVNETPGIEVSQLILLKINNLNRKDVIIQKIKYVIILGKKKIESIVIIHEC